MVTEKAPRGRVYPFWRHSWATRGITFEKDGDATNVHILDLFCLTGVSWAIRFRWFKRAWRILLFDGWLFIFTGKDLMV